MRRRVYKKYLLLTLFLLFALIVPISMVQKIRSTFLTLWAPLLRPASKWCAHSKYQNLQIEGKRLESENQLLRIEIAKLKNTLDQYWVLNAINQEKETYLTQGNKRRLSEASFLQHFFSHAVPASVIYRDPSNWMSSFWITAGEETNKRLGFSIVQKNSPVVVGRSVVGVIDFVGNKQSRVRLISDGSLRPAVRAVRGYPQTMLLIENIDTLHRNLRGRTEIPLSSEENLSLTNALHTLKHRLLEQSSEGLYLAKGVVQGRGDPLWRAPGQKLRGIGFNYDFADDEGPARDLQTGKPIDSRSSEPSVPLLKVHDLLVTTGMDGIFPAGLRIAEVTQVFPLKEGGYTYDIEAIPTVGNLDELYTVFVIPPVGFEFTDQ